MAEAEEELKGEVHSQGEEEALFEALQGVQLAGGGGAEMDDGAGDGDGLGGVAPFGGHAVVGAGGFKDGGSGCWGAVEPVSASSGAEGVEKSCVEGCGAGDPGVVTGGKTRGVVEP